MHKITRIRTALPILLLPLVLPLVGKAKDPLPDPTRPPASLAHSIQTDTPTQDAKLDLRAIFFSDGRRLAVINDQRLREQDRIGSVQVLEIMPDRVRLMREGTEFELTLVRLGLKVWSDAERADANGTSRITTAAETRETENDGQGLVATDSHANPIEAWGGPSTRHADAALAALNDFPAAQSSDAWDDQTPTLQTDMIRPSVHHTPGWVNALLGEGNEQ